MKWNKVFLIGLISFFLIGCQSEQQDEEHSESSVSSIISSEEDTIVLEGEVLSIDTGAITIQIDGQTYKFPEESMSIEEGDVLRLVLSGEPVTGTVNHDIEIVEVTVLTNIIEDKISSLIDEMSMEEKVGQMFLARLPEVDADLLAEQYFLGGYIWFARDFSEKTPAIIQAEITELHAAVPTNLFMAVDEEGGDVVRVSSFDAFRFEPFPSPQEAFSMGGWEEVHAVEREKAALLKGLGLNLNLAPVADVPINEDDFIYSRSFSTDAAEVADFVEQVVTIYAEEELGSVLKHFPGYGGNVDTHVGIAYDEREYQTFLDWDFIPFEAGIAAGANGILVSHNVITAIDDSMPATLSPEVISILREDLGYEGMIVTDDLIMDGLRMFTDAEEAAVLAVLAGNDLLISSEFTIQVPAVIEAVKSGRITEERIEESVSRILRTKIDLGIIE